MADRTLRVEYLATSAIRPAEKNARAHSNKQVKQISRSMRKFGFTSPILIDQDSVILAGHGRYAAALESGLSQVPCVRLAGLTELEARAYRIADNKIAENAHWDMALLASELVVLNECDFEMEDTGFDLVEIDAILEDVREASVERVGPEDDHPKLTSEATVSRRGDLWTLKEHRLLCGDAKEQDDVDRLMAGDLADMTFTDSPYNVRINGHVSGLGQVQHREFAEASGEMSRPEFVTFLTASFEQIERVSRSGAIVYACMDWRHLPEVMKAGDEVFTEHKNTCVWVKTNAGMGTFYRSQHEEILVWKVGDAAHVNNFGLGDKGRYRTNVWKYPGVNTFKADRMTELESHPTVKPVALVADAIRDVSHRGDIVFDPFGGSGTTLIAAERTGRRARLIEIDPAYCDVIIRRWQRLTGSQATLASNWKSFETVEAERLASVPMAEEAK